MAYNALYRKYRPSRFSEVIGQEHITDVLLNQVRTGRIAHAYLFSGTRGTGKTSTARIFARAINCLNPQDGEPCGECEACRINLAESIDIVEMDAASNSRVDEMRALLDKAEFAPIHLKTKIYIIDEAHMLSNSAENALLKTLEEPPAHLVFILATTEPQQLPATIISRCQRFDFRRLSIENLMTTTRRILADAGAEIDDDGLMSIARAADGGMRDCLSIADQCLSFGGSRITKDDVLTVLGSVNPDLMFDFAQSVLDSDAAAVMRGVEGVVSGGRDLGVFVQDLADHFRALLFAKVMGSCTDILDCTADTMQRYIDQAKNAGRSRLERTLRELVAMQPGLKWVAHPRVLLESTLMKLLHPEEQAELTALMDRIEELERKLREGSFVREAPQAKWEEGGGTDKPGEEAKPEETGPKEPVPSVVPDSYEVPAASDKAEELYKAYMARLCQSDIMLAMHLQLAAAHWCDSECLYFCFDKSKRRNYNEASQPESRSRLNRVAAECIAPYEIELVLKDGSVTVNRELPTEIFGVKITEE
ncbi:MAG: DNA polymerase III subunit gamma/tau [Clostridia bacterium]|nr:DNA polymerase III subunit gamma/tau [Clostridia bacterium]MBQ2111517.1 DNA polymerase III subunit gamma/tau [Clostridia bacterium]MBQ5488010.1 DNA polymerase III subunit gamma/tau [Clostridia bacterium]